MKKVISMIVSFALVAGMLPFCLGADGFADVDKNSEKGTAITKLYEAGIVNGFNDGLFHAERGLTRAQFCKMANKVFGFTEVGTESFSDVPATYWGATEISIAQKAGYIQGVGNNKFGPERALTREQVCIMLVRIIKPEPIEFNETITDEVSDWALADVKTALAYYMFSLEEGGKFRAQKAITRGEVSVVLARYLNSETPIVKPDSKYVMALKNLNAAFAKMEMTSAVKTVLEPVKKLLTKAIADADAGTVEVTKEYIEKTYASELKNIKKSFNSMNSTAATAMKNKIAALVTVDAAVVLYDTFLVVESSGEGGGGGGGETNLVPTPDNSKEVQAVRSIREQLNVLKQNDEFNDYQLTVVDPLINCLSDVLDDAERGVTITKTYVLEKHGGKYGAISEVREALQDLKDIENGVYYGLLRTKLLTKLSDDKNVLFDWFDIDVSDY